MTPFLAVLGFNLASASGIFWLTVVCTFAVVTLIWFIGLFQTDHSMMDGYYGFGYAVPVWIAYSLSGAASQTAAVILVLASLHGARLGIYLSKRWAGYKIKTGGGDQRYIGFVRKLSPGYWWKSFFVVMEPQAIVITVIGLPAVWGVLGNMAAAAGRLSVLSFLGIAIFGYGYYFETVADGQLQAFKADPNNKGRYLRAGVWTHTRHPNYFGNTVVWWGIWLVAVGGNPHIWWTAAGPVFNTIMLTKILGRAFQDKFMGSRPAYQQVISETNGFLPIPRARRVSPVQE
jgi:steroid 5-alpha reductase family enzyme